MFSPEDYWKILQYLSGKSVPELDSTVKSLAESERTKTRSLFENTIDQVCFSTEDYKRIRNFLIDWYSSHKTGITLQRNSHDPFVLPPEYLNELIKSFGYLYPADIASINIRTNFFLDLVNLYKIKGTPLSLRRALDYYGMRNVDLSEYWLQKNESGEIVFRGVSVFTPPIKLPWPDVKFEATLADPHWFQSKQDVIQLLNRNVIVLPSKTPYFGLRPFFSLSEIQQTISILVRMIADQYETWKTTSFLPPDIKLNLLNITVSLLENYLACIYIVNTSIDYHVPALYNADSYLCYDGTSEIVADIINEYETLTSYPVWSADDPEGDIANRKALAIQFDDLFTRKNSRNFIKTKLGVDSAGDLLHSINPDFKASIDSYISSGKYYELLASLLQDLSGWIRLHINTEATDIISIVLGISASPAVSRIINFFKPYRARLFTTQFCYIIDNPLFDFLRLHDKISSFRIIEKFYDYATADSLSCCSDDLLSCFDTTSVIEPLLYSREFYDCGSYHDIGIVWDQLGIVHETILLRDSLNCHTDSTCDDGWYWYDATSACDFWGSWMDVPVTDTTSDIQMIITGGFRDFDSCGVFDCLDGNDLVKIRLMPPLEAEFWAHPLSGYNEDALDVEFHDMSQGLVRHWDWDFGHGETSAEQNPLKPYLSPRAEGPIASWTSTPTTGWYYNTPCPWSRVDLYENFSGYLPGVVYDYSILTDIGDQTSHIFVGDSISFNLGPISGTGIVAGRTFFSAWGGNWTLIGISGTIPSGVPWAGNDTPQLTLTPTLTVSFTNTSTGSPTSFLWDFGDGRTSTDENPIHRFPRDDVFLVKLTVFNSIGNSTLEKSLVVES